MLFLEFQGSACLAEVVAIHFQLQVKFRLRLEQKHFGFRVLGATTLNGIMHRREMVGKGGF